MALTFDFTEKCGANGSYKGNSFEYGFGGFGDTFLLEGTYTDYCQTTGNGEPDGTFDLVGNYYPVVLTVDHTKGSNLDFTFTGSLTALVNELSSNPCILKADTEYDEEFTITLNWPFTTTPTDSCYVLKDGVEDSADMDRADTLIAQVAIPGKIGEELWADFEVMIKKAPYTKP